MTERTSTSRTRRDAVKRPRRSKTASYALVVCFAVLAVLLVAGVAEAAMTAGRVHPGVRVGGVEVGGLTRASAESTIERELGKRMASAPVVLTTPDDSFETDAKRLSASIDSKRLVAEAMAVGRAGGVGKALSDRVHAWFAPVDIPARATVDPKRLAAFLSTVSRSVEVAPKDADVRLKSGKVTIVASKPGVSLDRPKAENAVTGALLSSQRQSQAPTSVAEPAVTDDEAKAAQKVASAYLAAPATVVGEAKSWSFQPRQIAEWIAFKPVGADASKTVEAYIDEDLLTESTKGTFGAFVTPARDAVFKVDNGKVTIVPAKDGVGGDMHALASELTTALADATGPRQASLRIGRVKPERTTEEARAYGIKERLATFTTTYDPSNRPRVNNIHLLAAALNGKLIAPGDTFSFNGAIGQRTAEKGYQEANAIVNGKLVPQLGGGICQVCTTLFNAVFFSGLPVEQRINHYFYISHYPTGRDATVSWGGPDFKFTNDTGHWVLLATSVSPSSVTVSVYGTDPGNKVTFTTGPFTNPRPFKTEIVKDPELPKGVRVVEDAGIGGRSVVVERTVKRNGSVVRTDRFVSDYKPKSEIVRVGTKATASKTATQTPTKP